MTNKTKQNTNNKHPCGMATRVGKTTYKGGKNDLGKNSQLNQPLFEKTMIKI
jgi:hypothetical protein